MGTCNNLQLLYAQVKDHITRMLSCRMCTGGGLNRGVYLEWSLLQRGEKGSAKPAVNRQTSVKSLPFLAVGKNPRQGCAHFNEFWLFLHQAGVNATIVML